MKMLKFSCINLMILTVSISSSLISSSSMSTSPTTTKTLVSVVPWTQPTSNQPGCPSLIPCNCKNGTIDCSSRRLGSTPKFYLHDLPFELLNLNSNHITVLLENAFDRLKATEINLSFNKISNITDGAFNGVQSTVRVLNLQFNHLSTIPKAISYLKNLEELHISHNRIISADSIDTTLLYLRKFIASGNILTKWPTWIDKMPFLEELELSYNPISSFPADIHNLQWSIRKIIMNNCQIHEVPTELHQLRRLEILDMSYNPIGDKGFLDDSFIGQKHSLKELLLQDVNITAIPKALTAAKSLSKLDMSSNKLETIREDVLPENITELILKDCGLHRIPSALSDLQNLKSLELANNKILAIENNDLHRFSNLVDLDLSSNTLKHISPRACQNLQNIQRIFMFDNALTDIPEIVQQFPSLTLVNLEANPIHCTCKYVWPFQWMQYRSQVKLSGYCENLQGMDLSHFISNYVHYCHV